MTRPPLMLRRYLERAEGTRTPKVRLALDYLPWRRSRMGNPLDAREPWITFAARRELAKVVRRGVTVFEYGAGGSTLWFADRGAKVISVEHDRAWYDEMRNRVPDNVELLLREPDPDDGTGELAAYRSTDARYSGLGFRSYAQSIAAFAPVDIVLVDGRARASCAIHGAEALAPNGWLVLDDSNRPDYAAVFENIRWPHTRYGGAKPFAEFFAETTIWRRPPDPAGERD